MQTTGRTEKDMRCANIVQIEDMKSYFEDDDVVDDDASPAENLDGLDMLLLSRNGPTDRNELLAHIPDKSIADRLIMRYFTSSSPSQRKRL